MEKNLINKVAKNLQPLVKSLGNGKLKVKGDSIIISPKIFFAYATITFIEEATDHQRVIIDNKSIDEDTIKAIKNTITKTTSIKEIVENN